VQSRIVLVTGASSGIGEACALAFAALGARPILASRRTDRLEELARRIETEHGVESCVVPLDVRDLGVTTRVLEDLPPEWASIDVLVNNAGLALGMGPLAEGDVRDWETMIDTNVKGLLYVTRAVLPGMLERGRGHVVNIGSIAATDPYPGGAVYSGTKAAVAAITRGLRMDLVGSPIRLTNIEPGMVETEFSAVRFHGDDERAEKVYRGVKPLSAADIADIVTYVVTRPAHVNIDSVTVRPVAQASTMLIARS